MGPLPWPGGSASVRLVSSFFFHGVYFFALFPVVLGGLTANASLDCLCFAEVYVDREVRRLISFLYLYLSFVELKASMPCNSPARFTLLCYCEAAAVSWFLRLAPHLNHVWRRSQKCLFPCFFDLGHPGLSAITVGRGVEVACNDVCIIFHCDFPELAQELHGNVVRDVSFGGLLNLAVNRKYFRPKMSCIDVPWISSWIFTPSGSKVLLLYKMSWPAPW